MQTLNNLSIKNKIILICLTVASTSLLLFSLIVVLESEKIIKSLLINHLTALAKSTGVSSSAALLFDSKSTAIESLSVLKALPEITNAIIYDGSKNVFASYSLSRQQERKFDLEISTDKHLSDTPQFLFTDNYLYVTHPIELDNDLVGFVLLTSSLDSLANVRKSLYLVVTLSFFASVAIAYITVSFLHKIVTNPIYRLTQATKEISTKKDYTIRVDKSSNDEIGTLIDGFNNMISQIGRQDKALKQHKDELENQVAQRTQQLNETNLKLTQALQNMTEAKEVAEEANKAKSEFLASMSHEIRTPLNGVLGIADLLNSTQLTEQQRRYLTIAQTSGELLLEIINDILDISKIESGKFNLEEEKFDLAAMVDKTIDLFARQAHKKNLKLSYHYPWPMLNNYIGDESRIRQILVNLLGNALKFTHEGYIHLEISITPSNSTHLLSFKVFDTGIGISEEAKKNIFSAFTQADSSTTRKYGGTGLGLNICQQLVFLMKGSIFLSSEINKGSCFHFEIPLKPCSNNEAKQILESHFPESHWYIIEPHDKHLQVIETFIQFTKGISHKFDAIEHMIEALKKPPENTFIFINLESVTSSELYRSGNLFSRLESINAKVLLTTSDSEVISSEIDSLYKRLNIVERPVFYSQLQNLVSNISVQPIRKIENNIQIPLNTRVLLVEDTTLNQELATEMLEKVNLQVTLANDGSEALAMLDKSQFDLILMDCQMPVMDGFEATRIIKKRQESGTYCKIPVIALTANATKGDKQKCIDAGMDDYLSKPFSQQQLTTIISKWLPQTIKNSEFKKNKVEESDTKLPSSLENAVASGVLDKKIISDLCRMSNSTNNLLTKLISIYLKESPIYISKMEVSISEKDYESARLPAHSLKSYSYNLGAKRIGEICQQIENLSSQDNYLLISESHSLLKKEYEKVNQSFLTFLKEQHNE